MDVDGSESCIVVAAEEIARWSIGRGDRFSGRQREAGVQGKESRAGSLHNIVRITILSAVDFPCGDIFWHRNQ
jgi:hypothetical protein